MAAVGSYYEREMLDWALGGSSPVRPATWAVGLSLGAPNATSASELATGSGVTRQTVAFSSASFAGGTGSGWNVGAMTFGPVSAGCTISAMQVWDNTISGSGNMMFFGALATARTLGTGDSIVFAASALVITLS